MHARIHVPVYPEGGASGVATHVCLCACVHLCMRTSMYLHPEGGVAESEASGVVRAHVSFVDIHGFEAKLVDHTLLEVGVVIMHFEDDVGDGVGAPTHLHHTQTHWTGQLKH